MNIAILLYDGMTALDAIGPYEVLAAMPDAKIHFVAKNAGIITTDNGVPFLNAEKSISEVPSPDMFLIPGGPDVSHMAADEEVLNWIRKAHETTRWSTSVCTGALILGAAGVLEGLEATTHWMMHDMLRDLGAKPTLQRVVQQGKVMTAAGVSSGIDMALTLAAAEYGDDVAQEIQLIIEYDPEPPFNAGSPLKAPESVVNSLKAKFAELMA